MKSKMIKLLSILPITLAANVSANNFADVKLTHIKPEKSEADGLELNSSVQCIQWNLR